MNAKGLETSESSSVQGDDVPVKRQKLDPTMLSPNPSPELPNDSTLCSLEDQLAAVQIKLFHTTAMITHFQNQKKHIEEVLEEELDNLQVEREVDKKVMKQLGIRLAAEKRFSQQNFSSQESVDLLNVELKTRISEKMSNLLSQSFGSFSSPSPKTPDADGKLEAVKVKMEMELERMLEDSMFLGFNIEKGEMKEVKGKMLQDGGSGERKMSSAALETISGLEQSQAVLSEKTEGLKSRVDDMMKNHEKILEMCEELERMGKKLIRKKVGELGSEVIEDENPLQEVPDGDVDKGPSGIVDKGTDGVHEVPEMSNGHSSPSDPSDLEIKVEIEDPPAAQIPEHLKIKVSDHYVLASDQRWFEINWQEHYTQTATQEYTCKKCSVVMETKVRIQDHVWVSHFGGRFKCPHCIDSPRLLKRRYSIGQHVKCLHSDLYRTKKG